MRQATTAGQEVVLRWPLHSPESVAPAAGVELLARPFGASAEDLAVEFSGRPRPLILTRLLHTCLCSESTERLAEAELWNWSLARRMQALLAIAAATGGTRRQATVVCTQPACHQTMEIDLDLTMFRRACADETFPLSPAEDVRFVVRLPNGHDQLRYGQDFAEDPLSIAREMITGEGRRDFRAEWLPLLEGALEERDPLTCIELTVTCPSCGAENRLDFDLEGFLLRELERRQAALLDDIHRLALAYHWSEGDIVSLPPQRRAYYLECLNRETQR